MGADINAVNVMRVGGALLALAGLATAADGLAHALTAAGGQLATAAELDAQGIRLTRGIILTAGGALASATGGQVWRTARCRGRLSRRGVVLIAGGYLLVVVGLAISLLAGTLEGCYVAFGLGIAGAIAVGVGANLARTDSGHQ